MLYADYGNTGISVSRLGFGGMRFIGHENQEKCAELIKTAYDKGINYFDTAPFYCDDTSEIIFGLALREMQKTRHEKPFYVASKTMAETADEVERSVEKSLKRLQIPYIDFYHMWCIMSWDEYNSRKMKGALKGFERLREQGLIKNIVLSTHAEGKDIEKMLEDYAFSGVLLGYSAMNFAYRDHGLTAAARLSRGAVVMNPLGGGVIPDHPERFSFVRTSEDETVVEGALRFLFSDPRISVTLVGIGNEQHLNDALKALAGFKQLSEQKINNIRQGIIKSFDALCTSCGYCDHCPEHLPVPKLMDSYNQYALSGNDYDIAQRLHYHWDSYQDSDNHLPDCTACGACESACTQKLPIIERLQEVRKARDKHAEKFS